MFKVRGWWNETKNVFNLEAKLGLLFRFSHLTSGGDGVEGWMGNEGRGRSTAGEGLGVQGFPLVFACV